MPFSALSADSWFTIGSSVTALSTTLQSFTGSTKDMLIGSPREGYNLTVRIGSVYTGAINTAATAATSQVSYSCFVDFGDTTDFTSNSQVNQFPPLLVNFVIPASSTISVTTGVRMTQRVSTLGRYARVRLVTPSSPGLSATMITPVMEAILGTSTPA